MHTEPHLQPQDNPQSALVLTKAFFRAAEKLQFSRQEMAELLGISEATLSRLVSTKGALAIDYKEGEIALLFIRIFRSLDSFFGGNEQSALEWFNAHNHYLNGVPRQLIKKIGGLIHVADYLDAMRGKV